MKPPSHDVQFTYRSRVEHSRYEFGWHTIRDTMLELAPGGVLRLRLLALEHLATARYGTMKRGRRAVSVQPTRMNVRVVQKRWSGIRPL